MTFLQWMHSTEVLLPPNEAAPHPENEWPKLMTGLNQSTRRAAQRLRCTASPKDWQHEVALYQDSWLGAVVAPV